MKVFLLKDVEKIGVAGEIIKVSDGFATNFLIPRKLATEVTAANEKFFKQREKRVEHRQDVINSKTSMLAERIGAMKITLKKKAHDGGKLYGAVSQGEVAELLAKKGVSVAKNQIDFGKAIKAEGSYEVTVKLSSKLQPKITLTIIAE